MLQRTADGTPVVPKPNRTPCGFWVDRDDGSCELMGLSCPIVKSARRNCFGGWSARQRYAAQEEADHADAE